MIKDLITCSDNQLSENTISVADKRIINWETKEAQVKLPFEFEQSSDEKNNASKITFKTKEELINGQEYEHIASTVSAAFGAAGHSYLTMILNHTINAQFGPKHVGKKQNNTEIVKITLEALLAMDPQDIIEGQLCSRLLVLTNHINEFMSRAASDGQSSEVIDLNINRTTKLMRLHNETLQTLNRHRRKNEQKIIVQHINVKGGGQAVVGGEVNTTRG